MKFDIIKMSSKGQIVVPKSMRTHIKEGDRLMIIEENNRLIVKKASEFDKQIKEDLEFARRTEEAWNRIEKGKFKSMPADEFLEELEKWTEE